MRGLAEIHDGSLNYESKGKGNALVFIHGFSLDSRMWDRQFDYFASSFRVIRYDVRGFGRSSIPCGVYDHADDLAGLLSHLHVRRTGLVGLSMGGAIALHFTMKFPSMVSALVLADSSFGSLQPSKEAVSFKNRVPTSDDIRFLESIKLGWLSDDIFKPAMKIEQVRSAIIKMVEEYSGYHWLYENPVAHFDEGYLNRIKRINVPTLIVLGGLDVPKHRKISDTLERYISGSKKIIIGEAGHMSNMEKPEFFNSIVKDFLQNTVPGTDQ